MHIFFYLQFSRYSFANGRSSSHHPSIGNHLLRGEFMAYIYGHVLLDAIYSIEEVSAEKNEEVASNGSILVLEILKASSLSEVPLSVVPKSCHPSVCLHHARCYNNYFPHFETTSRSLESILLPLNSSSQWELRDNAALKSNPYHYQDHRAGFETSTPNVSIHFMVNITVAKSDIVVCGNENIQHAEVFVSIEETFLRRSGNCKSEINKLVRETWPPSKKFCIALKKDSYGLYFSPGEYVISICLGNSASTGASLLRITHVISF